jgi:LysM repeat protein
MRGKWFWRAFLIISLILPSFVFAASFFKDVGVPREKIREVAVSANLSFAQGGPQIESYSLLFQKGIRNADVTQVRNPEIFHTGGPTEPSISSVMGGSSIMKQSPPLTTVTAENIRTETTSYIVKSGDVPSVIAASFGITTNTLLWANNLSDGQYIKPGDELIILPLSGIRYKVKSGDTISGIAQKYKGETSKIIGYNNLQDEGAIATGDYLMIPDGEMPQQTYQKTYTATYASYTKNLDGYFIHPSAGIGYRSRGIHPHNAADIAASCWTPLYASAEGTVAISDAYGWNGGYGKYVKITHPNGTQTLYAHNIQNQVSAGQYVKQGQLIAYMGSTGRSTGCHVHWEVYGAKNPLR